MHAPPPGALLFGLPAGSPTRCSRCGRGDRGAQIRFSKKSSPTPDVARRSCMKAALGLLKAVSEDLMRIE
jgi:hypothetical protein